MRAAALMLALTAAPALADTRLAGRYDGVIAAAGVNVPATTVLTVTQDGRIAGRYSFADGPGQTEGELTGCAYAAPVLSCLWSDKYGSGDWVVAFSPDLKGFRGSWYEDSAPGPNKTPDGGFLWTGTRP